MAYWINNLNVGNGRNNGLEVHGNSLAVGSTQTTLISGIAIADYDKVSIHFSNTDVSGALNFQIWVSNASGTLESGTNSPLYSSISGGTQWSELGNPITVVTGASAFTSFETSRAKFLAITGSSNLVPPSGANINLFAIERH